MPYAAMHESRGHYPWRLLAGAYQGATGLLVSALLTSVLGGLGSSLLVAGVNQALVASAAERARLAVAFAVLTPVALLLRWISKAQFAELSQIVLARLRVYSSRRLAGTPYAQLEARGPASILGLLSDDVARAAELFTILPRLVLQGTVVLGCVAYLAYLSWQACLMASCIVLVGSLGRYAGAGRATEHVRRARLEEDGLYAQFRALFTGAKELKLHAARRAAFVERELGASIEAVRRQRLRGDRLHITSVSWGIFLFYVVIGGVVFLLALALDVSAEVRSGYALTLLYMMLPVHALLESIPELSRTRVALERIEELGMTGESAAVEAVEAAEAKRERFESVRLEGVTHRYRRDGEEGAFVLGPVSLELVPGEVVFVVGGNGSGKTTLAKLLVGLYAAEAGEVLLDGVVQRGAQLEAYRQHFSAVFSDFHLFSKLVGLGAGELDERANELLSALGLSHQVKVEGGSFSTTELSRGQQKRLALLVACLEDRAAIVFDEWAADQDPAYKAVFYERVLPWLKSRNQAVVVITHDDRYFHCADRCLTLDAGKLTTRVGRREPPPPRAAGKVDTAWL